MDTNHFDLNWINETCFSLDLGSLFSEIFVFEKCVYVQRTIPLLRFTREGLSRLPSVILNLQVLINEAASHLTEYSYLKPYFVKYRIEKFWQNKAYMLKRMPDPSRSFNGGKKTTSVLEECEWGAIERKNNY